MTNMIAAVESNSSVLEKAFALVCPRAGALRLAAAGLVTLRDAESVSWKGPISALVTDWELREAGVTAEQIAEAVEFYTATKATITREIIGSTGGPRPGNHPGIYVRAAGYSAGPAW